MVCENTQPEWAYIVNKESYPRDMYFVLWSCSYWEKCLYSSHGHPQGGWGKKKRLTPPPPGKSRKNLFCYMGGLFATFFSFCGGSFSQYGGLITTFSLCGVLLALMFFLRGGGLAPSPAKCFLGANDSSLKVRN